MFDFGFEPQFRDMVFLVVSSELDTVYKSYNGPMWNVSVLFWQTTARKLILYRIENRAFKMFGDHNINWFIHSFEHRCKVQCLSAIYHYSHGQC